MRSRLGNDGREAALGREVAILVGWDTMKPLKPNWRRFRRLTGWAAAYLLLAAALLGANPLRGETVGPFDLLASVPAWNPDGVPVDVRNRERSDIVDALVPGWLEARRQLREGTLPLWNPLPAGGTPALFDPVSVELGPGFLLFAAAPDPALGFYLSVLCCMVIAGLGMHLLVMRHQRWPTALFAGSSYMLCGFITAWLFWPHTHTAVWIPWLLLAVDSLAVRDSTRAYAGVACATALMVCGGFPFVAAIGMGAALVHGAVLAAARGPVVVASRTLAVLLAMVLGLMLAAIPLLTLVSSLGDTDLSQRRGGSGLSFADIRLLLGPWAFDTHRVESNMYVGVIALALGAVGLIAAVLRPSRNPLAWTGFVSALVGAVLVFGILPESIGTRLPVLSNNPWHRAILLLDIGLILLAAAGLGWLIESTRWRKVALAVALALCATQLVDLGLHFRYFNGPTPTRYFYAESPAIQYVRERINPFQHVAVDNAAFLISGTAGAAGLPDWYAHALRSRDLHGLLDAMAEEPFTTATATAISIRRYEWDDDLLDAVALCYALYPNSVNVWPVVLSVSGRERLALPPINHVPVVQWIRLEAPAEASAIAIRLATYRATDVDGEARLTLTDASAGTPLATAIVAGSQIRDNQMVTFRFGRPLPLPAGDYRIELRYTPGPAGRNVTAWTFGDAPGEVSRDGMAVAGSLDYALYGSSTGGLVPVFQDRSITVSVNEGCASGPYWIRGKGDHGAMPRSPARLSPYSPAEFSVHVDAPREGYVVIPMRLRAGWEASIDGAQASMSTVHGVLPAVKVPAGKSSVAFRYRPPHWGWGLAAMLMSVLALVWLWRAETRKPPDAPSVRPHS